MQKKSQGPSDILSWTLKDGCNEVYTHLTFLFNEYLKNNTSPQELLYAIVRPIYQK